MRVKTPSMYARKRAAIERAKQLAAVSPAQVLVPGRFSVTAKRPVTVVPSVAVPVSKRPTMRRK